MDDNALTQYEADKSKDEVISINEVFSIDEEALEKSGYKKLPQNVFERVSFALQGIPGQAAQKVTEISANRAVGKLTKNAYKVVLKDGLHLGNSRTLKGAYSGLAFSNQGNNLITHADWVPISIEGNIVTNAPQIVLGIEKLDEMLGKSNIIEHLDNNGLNCSYENLHVLSEDMNKAKAFSIDKKNASLEAGEIVTIPALITDVYYSHRGKYFQLQVFFNKDLVFNRKTNKTVETIIFHYENFDSLFIDWLYCFECINKEEFDVNKHHADRVYIKDATMIELREDEKEATMVERNGKYYLVIRTDPQKGPIAFMNHISYRNIEESIENYKIEDFSVLE